MGRYGVTIENVKFISSNIIKKDVLVASENMGGAVNVGGIYGFAYNNSLIDNAVVEINNGAYKAERKQENTTTSNLGVHVVGIVVDLNILDK